MEARVLLVANKTAATPALIEAVRQRAGEGQATFTLLVPASAHGLHTVVDPEDQDASEAEAVIALAVPLLEEAAGAPVKSLIGAPEPLAAVRGRGERARLRRDHHLDPAHQGLALAASGPAAARWPAWGCR